MENNTIQQRPISERPRERCLEQGSDCLSLRECLALLIGSGPKGVGCMGLAEQILNRSNLSAEHAETSFFTAIENTESSSIQNIKGLGPGTKAKLLACFEIARRFHTFKETQKVKTKPSKLLHIRALREISRSQRSKSTEWFGFIPYLQNQSLGELCIVERGVRTHVNIDKTKLFSQILMFRPIAIILAHNHPSGQLEASDFDIDLTRYISKMTTEFGIQTLGHWIVSAQSQRWIAS